MCSGNYVATAICEGGRMQGGAKGNILLTLSRGRERGRRGGGEVSLRESGGNFGAGIGRWCRCRR